MEGQTRRYQAGSRQTLVQALVAIIAAGASYAWAMNITPAPVSRQISAPEAMLIRALLDIRDSKFSSAFDHIELTAKSVELAYQTERRGCNLRPVAFREHAVEKFHTRHQTRSSCRPPHRS